MQKTSNYLTYLIFGRNLVVSNWLLMLGLLHFLVYALTAIAILLASGPPFEPISSFPKMFFSALIDYITKNMVFPILLAAGLVGRALVKRHRISPETAGSECGPQTQSCIIVSSFFGTSFQLPLWLLLPSISWFFYLAGEIRMAYSTDLPVGTPGWIGTRPNINDFWDDIVVPSLLVSMWTLGFWCFVTSICSALLLANCQHNWSIKIRTLVSAAIITPLAVVAGGLLIMIPFSEKTEEELEPVAENVLALHHSVLSGNTNEVAQIIDAGVNVNARDERGYTPLEIAIWEHDLNMMRFLIDSGADFSSPTKTKSTHLVASVYSGNVEAVKLLIASGADVNRTGGDQTAPLHRAARAESYQMVETLIEAGAKIDPRDSEDRTPLSHAAEMHRPDVVNLLLDHGANPDATHGPEVTPLMDALCEPSIRPDDTEGRERALMVANMLIDRGTSFRSRAIEGESALHCAVYFSDLSIVARMISLGADVNHTAASGAPITKAAWSYRAQSIEIAEVLLEHGARLDIPDSLGFYPIHRAAQTGNIEMLRLLLEHGADPRVQTEFGKTPLQWARDWDQLGAVVLLKEATRSQL